MVIAGDIFAMVFFGIYVVVLVRGRVFRKPDQQISPGATGCQDNDPKGDGDKMGFGFKF